MTGRLAEGRARLLLAAGLVLVALAMTWTRSEAVVTPGTVTPGFCTTSPDGFLECSPGTYLAGTYLPENQTRGFESDARVLLVPALAALVAASRRRTAAVDVLARAATLALAASTVLALGTAGAAGAPVATAAAMLAALSVAWPDAFARLRPDGRRRVGRGSDPAPGPATAF